MILKFDKDKLDSIEPKKLLRNIILVVVGGGVVGYLVRQFLRNIPNLVAGDGFRFEPSLLIKPGTWLMGWLLLLVFWLALWVWPMVFGGKGASKGLLGGKGDKNIVGDSALENSRFLTDKERDKYFPASTYDHLQEVKKDGVPVRAVLNKRGKLEVNFLNGAHSLVIGATGSGKTTTFINPMIQLLGATNCGSSMIMTDPKGELFSLHSKFLKERGYDVLLLDLRDTYSSSRWNPLDSIWDMYQEYAHTGEGIRAHRDSMADYPDLKQPDGPAEPGEVWIEWNGRAYADPTHCQDDITVAKQKIYDEMYEDLNDLISVICPIENEKDPLWEKGARSIIMATCLAMLEDSEDPRLGMTKDKFNFFNLNKALTNSENEFQALKEYFQGRNPLSQAVTLSRQVLSAADQTMSSYTTTWFLPATVILHSGRRISVRMTRSCVRLTASSMMRLCFRLRARASAAAALRRFPCGHPQRLRPLPPAKRAAFKTHIQTGAGYTLPARIGDFRPAEIGCFLPAQNGDFLPALTK